MTHEVRYPETPRVSLVTGGSQGIGLAIAHRLAERGDSIALADVVSVEATSRAAEDVASRYGVSVVPFQVDIRDHVSCQQLIEDVTAEFGQLDVLVNNAGVNFRAVAAETSESEWTSVIDTNLNGTFRMASLAFSALCASTGVVVNIASTAGLIAVKGSAAYAISKAGIIHLTRVLALEWAEFGVRVNAVGPTIVPTAMTQTLQTNTEYMREKLKSIPLGQMALPTDVAHAVAWLASSEARMVTGQTVFVDGGATIV